jgi:SAM-dependent methyltransferase
MKDRDMTDETSPTALFDLDDVFDVDDYMFVYDADLTDERSDAEVASLAKLLELGSPMRILDLACGFGRHANRLAALGHSVTGVDLMPGFLDIARRNAAAMKVEVDYRQGDMRRLSFSSEFDRVLLLFTSFGYFGDDQNAQVLENMARALRPGGCLMLDVANRDVYLKDLPPSEVSEKNGDLVVNRFSFDALTGRFQNRRIVIRNGVRKDKPFSIRLYNATEMRDLLNRLGLEDHKLLGEDGRVLSASSRRIVVIATKPQWA